MTILRIDIETYSSVDLKKAGVYAYSESPDFEVLLFAYAFGNDPVQIVDFLDIEGIPDNIYDALFDPAIIKQAFNAAFERTCLAAWFHEPMPAEQWRCTAVHALYLGLPNYLGGVGKVLNLEAQKDSAGTALIKYFSVPCKETKVNGGRTRNYPHHAPEKWEQYKAYCIQDVVAERAISHVLDKHPVPASEQKLWELDQKINDRGIRIDPALVSHAIACDAQYKKKLMAEAIEITGLSNPNSGTQLKLWLEAEGIEVENLKKENMPALFDQVESETAQRVLELRQELSKTSVKKYQAMERAICKDDRIRGSLQFYGAGRTGRWAGRIVQMHNLPKNYLSDLGLARSLLLEGNYELLEMLYGSIATVLSQLIRTTFIPSDGNMFRVSDFSAIEARVIAWLAGEMWRMEVFATHGRIYEASASQMFGVPLERIVKGNPEYALRPKGKVSELACGFGGGVDALIRMGALDMGIAESDLQGLINVWRAANPAITKFWKDTERVAIKALDLLGKELNLHHGITFQYTGGTLFCKLPSGRKLAYYKPRLEEGKYGKQLSYEGVDDKKQWTRLRTYGGKLVENIVQAIARDCLAESMLRLDDAGYTIAMHVHDEVIDDSNHGTLEEMFSIMGQPIAWAPGLPLRADGFETNFYKKDD